MADVKKDTQVGDAQATDLPVYTLAEIAKHNTEDDLWISIGGKVYDITKYANDHPGGIHPILDNAGTEATNAFMEVGHSSGAKRQLAQFLIGTLDPAEAAAAGVDAEAESKKEEEGHGGSITSYIIPIIVLLAALYYQFVFKPQKAIQN